MSSFHYAPPPNHGPPPIFPIANSELHSEKGSDRLRYAPPGSNFYVGQSGNRQPNMPPPPTSFPIPSLVPPSTPQHQYTHTPDSIRHQQFGTNDSIHNQQFGMGIESVQIQRTSSYDQNLNSRGGNTSPVPSSSGGSIKRTTSRIDPGQMPRPDKPAADIIYHTKSGSARKTPPSVNSLFTSIDTGNCNPRFMRSTLVAPPCNKDLLDQTGLPFALHVTPFASIENGEEAVPEVNLNQAPPRCSRCKCYINPSVTWTDGGHKWMCNMCNMQNIVPEWYFSSLDAAGLRMDRLQRPELIKGSVDFIVGSDYCIKPPRDYVFVFAIDTSEEAQRLGITISSLRAILKAVEQLEMLQARFEDDSTQTFSPNLRQPSGYPFVNSTSATNSAHNNHSIGKFSVGIVTFDENFCFYSVEQGCSDPVRMFVGNAEDPFALLPPHKWLYSIVEDKEHIMRILRKIPEVLCDKSGGDRHRIKLCSHAVIRATQDCLKNIGGKLYIFTTSHSTVGTDSISIDRSQIADYGSSQEILLYSVPPNIQQYSKLLKSGTTHPSISVGMSEMDRSRSNTSNNKSADRGADHLSQLKTLQDSCIDLATTCNKSNMSVVPFFFPENFVDDHFRDSSFLNQLSFLTGGRFYLVRGSMLVEDNISRLEEQLLCDLQCCIGSDSAWKLRTSVGLRVGHVIGMGQYSPLDDEVQMSSIDSHSTTMYLLKYDGGLKDEDKVFLQLAILYTALNKQRKVRVHNITLIASNKASTVFRNSDIEAVVSTLVKLGTEKAMTFPLNDEKNGARSYLQHNLIEILLRYRKLCSAQSPRGQLILPEALKVLPIYTLSALKHAIFIENSSVGAYSPSSPNSRNHGSGKQSLSAPGMFITAAERNFEARKLMGSSLKEVINTLYPRLFNLLYLIEEDGQDEDDHHDSYTSTTEFRNPGLTLSRPPSFLASPSGGQMNSTDQRALLKQKKKYLDTFNATAEVFESDQIYVLDDRSTLYLYVGRSVPQDLLEELFLLSSKLPYDRPEQLTVRNDTVLGRRVQSVLAFLRSDHLFKQDMKVLWADLHNSNPSLHKFATRLIEDSNAGMMAYVDFLCNVHARIQSKL